MSGSFLLRCECGQTVVVRPTQAGETVRCTCDRQFTVPSMRVVRNLPPAAEDDASPGTVGSWSVQLGMLFSLGMVVFLVALGALVHFGWQRSKIQSFVRKPIVEDFKYTVDLNQVSPTEAWSVWMTIRDEELSDRRIPAYLIYRRQSAILENRMRIAGGFLVGGLLLGVTAVLFGRRARTARRTP